MNVACVYIHVKPEHRQAFLEATLDNARNSILEPGNIRFDVHQSVDDPNRFLLYEIYRDDAGVKAHKQTAHYARWAATAGPLMAEPRQRVEYSSQFVREDE